MAIGEDRVQVTKVESTALGGKDSDRNEYGAPIPINPEEDAIESAGGYVQEDGVRDENVGYCRGSGNLQFFDQVQAVLNLTTLFFVPEVIPETKTFVVPEDYQFRVYKKIKVDGKLIVEGKLVI